MADGARVGAGTRPRSRLLAACLTTLVVGAACDRARPAVVARVDAGHSTAALSGQVFHHRAVAVRPAEGWAASSDGAGWLMTIPCRLVVDIAATGGSPLTVAVRTAEDLPPGQLRARWDGQPLPASAVASRPGGFAVSVEPDAAKPGFHELVLEASGDAEPGTPRLARIGVDRVSVTLGRETLELDPARLPDDQWLARFQTLGVFPDVTGKLHSGGFVFDGPGEVRCTLSPERAAILRLDADNRSSAPAVFVVDHAGVGIRLRLAPGESAPLEVPLTPGTKQLNLAVEGEANGLFLWSRPRMTEAVAPALPPIIVITIDTTRRDVIPPFADRDQLAPNLARFADSATVFESAFSTAPWTLPSHASIFTGLVPSRHGAGVTGTTLGPRFLTLAEALAHRGYRTAGMAGGIMCAANRGLAQGFASYRDPDTNETRADSMTDGAVAWLEELDGEAPFLFLNYFDPHYPYNAPEAFRAPGVLPLAPKDQPPMTIGALNTAMAGHGVLPPELRRRLVAAYEAEIRFLDHEIGRLLDALERLGLYDEAFIAIVSDHGEMLGEKGYLFHSYRLEPELVHIPYLVKWPRQDRSAVVRTPVSLVDLYPTVLGISGVEPGVTDGRVLPRTDDDGRASGDVVLCEEHSQRELNPLAPHRNKIADHLWATADAHALTIVWDGGAQCLVLDGSQWRSSPCPAAREGAARLAVTKLDELAADHQPSLDPLTEDERAQLEALGYLP